MAGEHAVVWMIKRTFEVIVPTIPTEDEADGIIVSIIKGHLGYKVSELSAKDCVTARDRIVSLRIGNATR